MSQATSCSRLALGSKLALLSDGFPVAKTICNLAFWHKDQGSKLAREQHSKLVLVQVHSKSVLALVHSNSVLALVLGSKLVQVPVLGNNSVLARSKTTSCGN